MNITIFIISSLLNTFLSILGVRCPPTSRTVTRRPVSQTKKGLNRVSPFNPYFYVSKYRSSDALPASKIFICVLHLKISDRCFFFYLIKTLNYSKALKMEEVFFQLEFPLRLSLPSFHGPTLARGENFFVHLSILDYCRLRNYYSLLIKSFGNCPSR